MAIESGYPDNFYFLIKELNLDYIKRFDQYSNSCLHLCAINNHADFLVAILEKVDRDPLLTQIDKQFFINHQNQAGNTALHEAALRKMQTVT